MASPKALADRWRSEAGAALADEAIARLVAGRSLDGLGLDEHDGRVDLRFLPTPIPRRLERFEALGWFVEALDDLITFRGVELAHIDLSGAQLQHLRFFDTKVTDCCFDGAVCRDWRMWNTSVTRCSFVKADLRDAAVGTWRKGRRWRKGERNEWRQVDFTRADFRVAVSEAAVFVDCEFRDTKLAKVEFSQCTLLRCRFAGLLKGVVFDERVLPDRATSEAMVDVDFAEAYFDQVEFRGCRLDRVVIPADPDLTLVRRYRCVVEHALELLEGNESDAARMLRAEFQNTLRGMRSPEEDNVLNTRDYQGWGDEFAALADDVFTKAQAACRHT